MRTTTAATKSTSLRNRLATALAAALGATCACALSACDEQAAASAAQVQAPATVFRSLNVPGKVWGPCSAVECEFGSECVKATEGTYCAPNCAWSECTKVQVDACGDLIGEGTAVCEPDYVCKRLCNVDADCGVTGMVCSDPEGFCVNPNE